MAFPLIALLFVGGAAVAVAASGKSSKTKTATTPKSSKFSGSEVDRIFHNSEVFLKNIAANAGNPSSAQWPAIFKKANEAKDAAEAATRQQAKDMIDDYRDKTVSVLLFTGVGVVAIPAIYLMAVYFKYAVGAQITLIKAMFGTNGWSETWQNNMNGELAWLRERGIPFPAWNDGKGWVSPMGWVNGGGGTTCGHGGLCAIREAYGKYLGTRPLEMASAMRAWKMMSRHIMDNPLVMALYTRVGSGDGSFLVCSGDGIGKYFDGSSGPRTDGVVGQFNKLFVAALATAVCQERNVPFALWQSVINDTQTEFDRLYKYWSGASFPLAESVGSTFDMALTRADNAVVKSGGLLTLTKLYK